MTSEFNRYVGNIPYGIGKARIEKLVADMAEELRPHHVASVSLYPGFTRTEDVINLQARPPGMLPSTPWAHEGPVARDLHLSV